MVGFIIVSVMLVFIVYLYNVKILNTVHLRIIQGYSLVAAIILLLIYTIIPLFIIGIYGGLKDIDWNIALKLSNFSYIISQIEVLVVLQLTIWLENEEKY